MVDYELGYQGGHQGDDLLSPMAWLLSSPFFSRSLSMLAR